MQKLLVGKDARMLRDLLMEEIYRRLQNPFHKYSENATSTTVTIKSEEDELYSNNFVKEIKYIVVDGMQLNDTQYVFNAYNNSVNIPNLVTGSKVVISYTTCEENDAMMVLYRTGKMLSDNNCLLSDIKVPSEIDDEIIQKGIIKQDIAKEYRKIAISLYDEVIPNDPNENGYTWADE